MKVTLFVRESRAKSSKGSAQLPLIICFRNGKMNLWQTTRLSVNPDWWDQDHQQLKARMAFNPKQRQEFDNKMRYFGLSDLIAVHQLKGDGINAENIQDYV